MVKYTQKISRLLPTYCLSVLCVCHFAGLTLNGLTYFVPMFPFISTVPNFYGSCNKAQGNIKQGVGGGGGEEGEGVQCI